MKTIFIAVLLSVASIVRADAGIAGFWQHEKEPVWIEMRPDSAVGVVVRNDNRRDRVEFQVVTELTATDKHNVWAAQVYAAQLQEYRNARITLESEDLMSFTVKVGFITRTVEWQRVSEVPNVVKGE